MSWAREFLVLVGPLAFGGRAKVPTGPRDMVLLDSRATWRLPFTLASIGAVAQAPLLVAL